MDCTRIIVVGTGTVAAGCIERAVATMRNVSAVEPEAAGFSTVKATCTKLRVEYRLMPVPNDLTGFLLGTSESTLVVSAHNMYIFPEQVLRKKNLNVVNFHNSLLPAHGGRNAPTWVIFAMESTSGVTWHQVAPRVDRGDIIVQSEIAVGEEDTGLSLTRRCVQLGLDDFSEILPKLLSRSYLRVAQPSEGVSYHWAREIPNHGVIDLSWSARKVSAFLRSVDYGKLGVFPPTKVSLLGSTYEVAKYELMAAGGDAMNSNPRELTLRDNMLFLRDGRTGIRVSLR